MFTKSDHRGFLRELRLLYADNLRIYTDLLNVLDDKAARNKLFVLADEDMGAFELLEAIEQKYFKD